MSLNEFQKLIDSEDSTKEDEAQSNLGEQLEALRKAHLQERFYWVLLIVIIFDTFFFVHMQNWAGPMALLILEGVGLVVFAKNCGVDLVIEILDKILASWKQRNDKD